MKNKKTNKLLARQTNSHKLPRQETLHSLNSHVAATKCGVVGYDEFVK